jgi:hypothetical protein
MAIWPILSRFAVAGEMSGWLMGPPMAALVVRQNILRLWMLVISRWSSIGQNQMVGGRQAEAIVGQRTKSERQNRHNE